MCERVPGPARERGARRPPERLTAAGHRRSATFVFPAPSLPRTAMPHATTLTQPRPTPAGGLGACAAGSPRRDRGDFGRLGSACDVGGGIHKSVRASGRRSTPTGAGVR